MQNYINMIKKRSSCVEFHCSHFGLFCCICLDKFSFGIFGKHLFTCKSKYVFYSEIFEWLYCLGICNVNYTCEIQRFFVLYYSSDIYYFSYRWQKICAISVSRCYRHPVLITDGWWQDCFMIYWLFYFVIVMGIIWQPFHMKCIQFVVFDEFQLLLFCWCVAWKFVCLLWWYRYARWNFKILSLICNCFLTY